MRHTEDLQAIADFVQKLADSGADIGYEIERGVRNITKEGDEIETYEGTDGYTVTITINGGAQQYEI